MKNKEACTFQSARTLQDTHTNTHAHTDTQAHTHAHTGFNRLERRKTLLK